MKAILLSLLLMISPVTNAFTYTLQAGNIPLKESTIEELSKIYFSCIALATNKTIVKKAKGRILAREKIIVTDSLASRYVYNLCMAGNYDIEYNNIIKKIQNMGVKL